jgi:hypothetical protein
MAYPEDRQRAEDKRIKELNERFLASIKRTIEETNWDDIEAELLAIHAPDQIANEIAWQEYDPSDILEDTFQDASGITKDYIGDVLGKGTGLKFDLTDPNAIKWLEEFGAAEIKYISDSQRQALKDIVLQGYQKGITYQQQARQIKQIIGLDLRRAEAVSNLRERLKKRGKLSDEKIEQKTAKYADKLLRQRARTIAVQEATVAGARGFYSTTKEAVHRGILDPNKYEGYRIVTGDERLCPQCSALAGAGRTLPDGTYRSSGSVTPKLHHLCRCVEGIREIKMGKNQLSVEKRASGEGKANVVFDCQALKRKDGILYVPTIPLVECVYEQWGQRVLRSYAEFSQYSHWLHGVPVVVNHEDVSPEARRIGQLFDITNKPEALKSAAVTRFYEIDLTQRELEALLSGEPHDGSLRWECWLVDEPGEWVNPTTGERKQYDVREVGPYVFHEYSLVKAGVVSTKDGAGFNMQCSGCKSSAHGAVSRGNQMAEEGNASGHEPELTVQLEAAQKTIEDQEKRITALEGGQKAINDSIAARAEAEEKARFVAKLKPGRLAEADTLWQECKETGYLVFEAKHPEMIIQPAQERKLKGSSHEEGEPTFDLAKEQAKIKYGVR